MNVLSEEFSVSKLNKPTDWNNLTGMAKKHVPIIEAPSKVKADTPFAVKIKIGGIDGIEHPNTLSHWINWVALYAGDNTKRVSNAQSKRVLQPSRSLGRTSKKRNSRVNDLVSEVTAKSNNSKFSAKQPYLRSGNVEKLLSRTLYPTFLHTFEAL